MAASRHTGSPSISNRCQRSSADQRLITQRQQQLGLTAVRSCFHAISWGSSVQGHISLHSARQNNGAGCCYYRASAVSVLSLYAAIGLLAVHTGGECILPMAGSRFVQFASRVGRSTNMLQRADGHTPPHQQRSPKNSSPGPIREPLPIFHTCVVCFLCNCSELLPKKPWRCLGSTL